MSSLIKKLKDISKEANACVEDINHGGCCVMAHLIAKEMRRLGVEAEGVASSGNPLEIRKIHSKTGDGHWWESNGVDFEHVAVRFKYKGKIYTYDTDILRKSSNLFGLWEYTADGEFGSGLRVSELKKIASTRKFWNTSFNRKDIPVLKKIVEKHFKQIKIKGGK